MAKRKKPVGEEFGTAVNSTDDLKQQVVLETEVYDGEGDPRLGVFVVHTPAGHYQFLMTEAIANEMIQHLRDFLAEDSERLP